MPFSSHLFLGFKWWRTSGLDLAVWVCQKRYFDPEKRAKLTKMVQNQTPIEWSSWLIKLLNLGHPSVMSQIQSGHENIWITDLTLAQNHRSGSFPRLFQGDIFPEIAGITFKKVLGSERPNVNESDLTFDVILTLCPASEECPTPILHRNQIPQWTIEQREMVGRYTTGPLFTHWTKM